MQRLNNADSLIPTLASLYRWTWFYWGQNRFGMLTGLLAMPIHHPLMNLLFQNWMVSFCGLLFFPLMHTYVRGWRTAPISGLAGAAVFLLGGPDCFHMDYLLANQPYAVSSCLGLLGLMILAWGYSSRYRAVIILASATILLFLAYWVSMAAVFLTVPVFALRSLIGSGQDPQRRKQFLAGALVIIVAALGNWAIVISNPDRENYGWTPVHTWPGNCAMLLVHCHTMILG